MPLIVGNLLADPLAQSFISLADAEDYLSAEAAGSGSDQPLGRWLTLTTGEKESSLVSASRWLAVSLSWCSGPLLVADLVRVGRVAAKLAVAAKSADLWASEEIGKMAKRYKADTVEIEYHSPTLARGAIAGGRRFPWIYPMLRGLLCGGGVQHDVVRR